MPSRLNYISKRRNNNKRVYKNIKYPEIPLSVNDLYIMTTSGDRLDTLANQFYQDVDLWWIITTANPDVVRRDSFNLKPGIEIRIPSNVQSVIESFEALNK